MRMDLHGIMKLEKEGIAEMLKSHSADVSLSLVDGRTDFVAVPCGKLEVTRTRILATVVVEIGFIEVYLIDLWEPRRDP